MRRSGWLPVPDTSRITVHKFGGSSVGNASAITKVLHNILLPHLNARRKPIAVLSAMLGVTNHLIHAARAACVGQSTKVREIRSILRGMHAATLAELVDDHSIRIAAQHHIDLSFAVHFDEICERIASHKVASDREMDAISSAGERWSAHLINAHMEDRGVLGQLFEADTLIVTDEISGNARPLLPQTKARVEVMLLPALERGAIPIITGFFGASEKGLLTTLGRGGTDLSAAIIGACVGASEILLWKVEHSVLDGTMTWQPGWEGVVHDAMPQLCIPNLSYEEAGALAHLGKKVLHPDTVLPAIELGIPIGVRNTLDPRNPCTLIAAFKPQLSAVSTSRTTSVARLRTVTSLSVAAYEARHKQALAVDWEALMVAGVGKEHWGLVALVGYNASLLSNALLLRIQGILKCAGVHNCLPLPFVIDAHALIFVVPEGQRKVAVRALHAAFGPEFDVDVPLTEDDSVLLTY